MTEAALDAGVTEALRARIAAVIGEDLAAECAAGFPLVRRFPNSELASVPDSLAHLITEENLAESVATMRETLERLTALGKRVNALTPD